jgi:hypothetical protein
VVVILIVLGALGFAYHMGWIFARKANGVQVHKDVSKKDDNIDVDLEAAYKVKSRRGGGDGGQGFRTIASRFSCTQSTGTSSMVSGLKSPTVSGHPTSSPTTPAGPAGRWW